MDLSQLKKRFTLMVLCIPILIACGSLGKKQEDDKYHFLFNKTVKTRFVQDCIAAYYRGSFLFFFASYYNKVYKATVYNPATGEFAELPIINKRNVSCKSLPYKYEEPQLKQWIRVGVIRSKNFREIFNHYKSDTETLQDAINAIPSSFRQDGEWKGETTFTLTNKTIEASNLQDVVDYFLSHTPHS